MPQRQRGDAQGTETGLKPHPFSYTLLAPLHPVSPDNTRVWGRNGEKESEQKRARDWILSCDPISKHKIAKYAVPPSTCSLLLKEQF